MTVTALFTGVALAGIAAPVVIAIGLVVVALWRVRKPGTTKPDR